LKVLRPKLMVAAREHQLRDIGHQNLHLELAHYYKVLVNTYLISCWHMNEQESAAMWSLYLRSNEGVCIQSTYRRLRSSLPRCVRIGEVNYLNYDNERFLPQISFNFTCISANHFTMNANYGRYSGKWMKRPKHNTISRRLDPRAGGFRLICQQ
jgi:hypothetical protein